MNIDDKLKVISACAEARCWMRGELAEGRTPDEAWLSCDRPDWMLWLVARCAPTEARVENIDHLWGIAFDALLAVGMSDDEASRIEALRQLPASEVGRASSDFRCSPWARSQQSCAVSFSVELYMVDGPDDAWSIAADLRAYLPHRVPDYCALIREAFPTFPLRDDRA